MADWRVARLIVLGALVTGLGTIVYRQGFGWQLGGAPARIEAEYQTEEAWITGEIVRDITEMSAYAASAKSRPGVLHPEALGGGRYKVPQVGTLTSAIELNLADDLWSPTAFATLARAALGPSKDQQGAGALNLHLTLTDMTPSQIVQASNTASKALARNMRDAHAHESAALVLGAFALRESAAFFSDVRWTMNRMTAHLAMANALRAARQGAPQSAPPGHGLVPQSEQVASIDGALSEVLLHVLNRRQTRALEQLARLGARKPSAALEAWRRALQVRVTQDWRLITLSPTTTPLEELEYLRARRPTVLRSRGIVEAETLQVERADALRIVQAGGISIEDGHVIARDGLDREHEESAQVYQRIHDRALFNSADGRMRLDAPAITSLNARATRAIGPRGPDVLPWGAWAEFSQRHLAMLIGNIDRFYRHRYGDAARANAVRAQLDAHLGGLTLFPVATTLRTKGVKGGDADLTYINEAITLGVTAPELVTARLWAWLESGGRYEPLRRAMPVAAQWFVMPSARVPYDGALRMEHLVQGAAPAATMTALWTEAPYDYWLATNHLKSTHGKTPPDAEVHRVLGPRLGYDLRAIREAANQVNDNLAKLVLRERGCEIAVPECASYARMLATLKRPDDAAREFERTFADPSYDRVAFANETGWLVNYYYERKKIERALELAEEAVNVGSARGLYTAGELYERLGRDEDAEEVYELAATRYEDPSELLGFYRRAVYERKKTDFERGWKRWLPVMFPQGLTAAAAAAGSAPKPERGVTVMKDSAQLRKAGLQAGDLIIGLEGWRVDNLQQFRTIDAFDDRPDRTLTVWRGPIYQVKLPARSWRSNGVEFRSYPIQGWAE